MAASIRVIADSVCDVPHAVAEALHITLVPTVVTIAGTSYLDDGKELSREAFYDEMPGWAQLPTTSGPPLGLTRDLIAAAAAEAEHLILISAPAHLSSIHNIFRITADEVAPGRYTLIDSGQTTFGEGFQVVTAAKMALAGASAGEIVAALDDMRPRIRVFGALKTMENLRKGGRVGWATAIAGRLLQIKPLVELTEGIVTSRGNIRTFKRVLKQLIQLGLDNAPLERLAVLHTNNLPDAEMVRHALAAVLPPDEVMLIHVNPSLGTHVGAQAVGLALVKK